MASPYLLLIPDIPIQTYASKSLYQTFETKAAMLFYLMIKNHPFQNGNKRVAVITLYYFLDSNGRKLKVGNRELYEFAREVAASEATDREKVASKIRAFILEFSEKIRLS